MTKKKEDISKEWIRFKIISEQGDVEAEEETLAEAVNQAKDLTTGEVEDEYLGAVCEVGIYKLVKVVKASRTVEYDITVTNV